MTKTYVLYHGVAAASGAIAGCYDGFGAAWAARESLGESADIQYIPVAYGQPAPTMQTGSSVYLVDFSYPAPVLLELCDLHKSVVVLDHHKTAEEALKGLEHPSLSITFDMNKSGARITWEHFFPQKPVPQMVQFIEDRDLWRFALPGSLEVHTYLQSFPFDFQVWDKIYKDLEDDVKRGAVIEAGMSIVRFRDSQLKMMCKQASLKHVFGYLVPVVNATCFWSEVGNELLAQYPESPFSVSWFKRADGLHQYSLRSRKEFDCSVVAKGFGGGGHAQASGFQVTADVEVYT